MLASVVSGPGFYQSPHPYRSSVYFALILTSRLYVHDPHDDYDITLCGELYRIQMVGTRAHQMDAHHTVRVHNRVPTKTPTKNLTGTLNVSTKPKKILEYICDAG